MALPTASDAALRGALRDGALLCHLLNILRPGVIPKVQIAFLPASDVSMIMLCSLGQTQALKPLFIADPRAARRHEHDGGCDEALQGQRRELHQHPAGPGVPLLRHLLMCRPREHRLGGQAGLLSIVVFAELHACAVYWTQAVNHQHAASNVPFCSRCKQGPLRRGLRCMLRCWITP